MRALPALLTSDERGALRVVGVVVGIARRVEFAFIAVAEREVVTDVDLRVERVEGLLCLLGSGCEQGQKQNMKMRMRQAGTRAT